MNAPDRLLVLDASDEEPAWLICTVTGPNDVMPATLNGHRWSAQTWDAVNEWVRSQVGPTARLTPVSGSAWKIEETP